MKKQPEPFVVTVYFAGPATTWARKLAAEEIIAQREFRWRWVARMWARSVIGPLNAGRCGYVITQNVLEQHEPPAAATLPKDGPRKPRPSASVVEEHRVH